MHNSAGIRVLQTSKVDIASKLRGQVRDVFRPGSKIELIGPTQSMSTAWNRAVRAFASATVACGMAAAITMAPAPAQARDTTTELAAPNSAGAARYVNLANMKFSELVEVRDQLGLDEDTLREHGMAQLNQAAVDQMSQSERAFLVGGLYWAAESLEGFDRATAEGRAVRLERGDPARSSAEEVQAWERWLDSRAQARPSNGKAFVVRNETPAAQTTDPAALKRTVDRLQTILLPRSPQAVEHAPVYPSERP